MTRRTAWLVLEDGAAFPGRAVGAEGEAFGEVVFNTSMTGYQEILTDPSYKGQMVCMTYPHIGNYGVNEEDVESRRPWVEGFIMRELSPIASSFRAQEPLEAYLKRHHVLAIDGIDTRALTLILREQGSMKGGISTTEHDPQQLLNRVRASAGILGRDLIKEVTCLEPYGWPIDPATGPQPWPGGPLGGAAAGAGRDVRPTRGVEAGATGAPVGLDTGSGGAARRSRSNGRHVAVVVIDYGVKYTILRRLAALGCRVEVVPAAMPASELLAREPDGVVLSNGPGDPAALPYAVETIRGLMGRVPILGICLGHQLLGIAYGGRTIKLKFGHHGANHPVQECATGKVAITAQNHNFAVQVDAIPDHQAVVTHINLNDQTVEGMRHATLPIVSLQYHPEASPGPHDAQPLFSQFLQAMKRAHPSHGGA